MLVFSRSPRACLSPPSTRKKFTPDLQANGLSFTLLFLQRISHFALLLTSPLPCRWPEPQALERLSKVSEKFCRDRGFLTMRRVFISYSQPIRFARFDGKSMNCGLPVLDQALRQARRIVGSGDENASSSNWEQASSADAPKDFRSVVLWVASMPIPKSQCKTRAQSEQWNSFPEFLNSY